MKPVSARVGSSSIPGICRIASPGGVPVVQVHRLRIGWDRRLWQGLHGISKDPRANSPRSG